ncbi:molybdopterin-guanine dinucleotide biosynthesis protein B [Oceanibacterium hippocampi]|uniref:Molybdopterin-guanine dinucleotide biosynthesis adapter protein n=1 Tax=Oceanibacterium hippocampi TaxID=745714 RepID=A0A1Y5TVP4_9PROT|nr:molybdopterin-guanine dinucleotide biosynthesis protein B [Oceanibacterium hippocampi]SLN74459.1 Molybdopterin-guanine dinucleotide biosynthesis adapter protein [Oceanibacterium hippocampi]
MRVLGISGWSGSGKTTLVSRLIPVLTATGLRVSTIKHAHHGFDVDRPGKDSWRHREAGATEVMVSSAKRWALMHEHREETEADLAELLRHMSPVDLVLVEGFKHENHPKIEIWRAETGQSPLAVADASFIAFATDAAPADVPAGVTAPRIDLNDVDAVARFILDFIGTPAAVAEARG